MKGKAFALVLIFGGVGILIGVLVLFWALRGADAAWQGLGAVIGGTICTVSIILPVIMLVLWVSQQGKKTAGDVTAATSSLPASPAVVQDSRSADNPVIDLRSPDNRQREQRVQQPLVAEDETIAQELARLSRQIDAQASDAGSELYRDLRNRVREIGEALCADGGSDRMDLICYRVYHLHGHSRHVRLNWSGICGWEF